MSRFNFVIHKNVETIVSQINVQKQSVIFFVFMCLCIMYTVLFLFFLFSG